MRRSKVKQEWLGVVCRICRCETDDVSYRAVCQEAIVGTEGSVGDGPLPVMIGDSLDGQSRNSIQSQVKEKRTLYCFQSYGLDVSYMRTLKS